VDKKFKSRLLDSRLLLLAGFSTLILMPAIAFHWGGEELARASKEIRSARLTYFETNKLLNDLKMDLINGGTYLRDYLLEPSPDAADLQRRELIQARSHALEVLSAKQLQESGKVYRSFVAAYDEYWKAIEPVLNWDAEKRKRDGYAFLRAEAFARRTTMLGLAAKIGAWNEEQLIGGEREIQEIFRDVRNSQRRSVFAFLMAGLGLASFVYWRITTLERQASERLEQAEAAREESRGLSARLLAVQEEERKAISRELHDGVAQNLSALRLGIEEMMRKLPEEARHQLGGEAAELGSLAKETLQLTRNLSLLLRPSMLDDLGLAPALRWLAREWQKRCDVVVEVDASEELDGLEEEVRICVFRVVQEAVNNAVTHGKASKLMIRAHQREGQFLVSIQDDGKSFDADKEKGMGILGMTERVEKLGGKFSIVSKQDVGTVVMAELP
jgi:signal transduction histidine kinase